jgi:hypothetical protein
MEDFFVVNPWKIVSSPQAREEVNKKKNNIVYLRIIRDCLHHGP